MKHATCLAVLLATAGCATYSTPDAPVHNIRYSAMGEQPFWMIVIGDDLILFRQTDEGWRAWPRTLPRTADGIRTWRSGEDDGSIVVEASRRPCSNGRGQVFEDQVVVHLNGNEFDLRDHSLRPFNQTLTGCGGRPDRGSQGS